jgi:hypothetical protein
MINNSSIGKYFKSKLEYKVLLDHEVVVAIIAMAEAGYITEAAIKPLILEVFNGDIGKSLNGLRIASSIIDRDHMEAILN